MVNSLISPLSRLCRLLTVNPSLEEMFTGVLNFMLLKPDLNKGSSGNPHRDWVYANSVCSLKPGNLIHGARKPVTFDSRLYTGK